MTRAEQHDFGFAAASPAWLPSAPAPAPWDIAAGTHTNVYYTRPTGFMLSAGWSPAYGSTSSHVVVT